MVRSSVAATDLREDGSTPQLLSAKQSAKQKATESNWGDRIVSYIPTEVIGSYQVVVSLALSGEGQNVAKHSPYTTDLQLLLFKIFWALTPAIAFFGVAVAMHLKNRPIWKTPKRWPWASMFIGGVAFPIWVACLPGTVFLRFSGFHPYYGAIAAVILALVLAKFAPLFKRA